jgi:uncharacterized membrane protein YdjX (TVP38/TMEM64 family)
MNRALYKRIFFVVALVAVVILIRVTGLSRYLTLENLQAQKNNLQDFVGNNYWLSVVSFIALYIVVAGLSLPGATIMTLGGGFFFGALLAALYVNVGATSGAVLAFLFSRYVAGTWVQNKYPKKLSRFNHEVAQHGSRYLLTLRFIPLFPFFLINIFAGLTKISLKTFIWTTSLGIFPGSLVYSFAGSQLTTLKSVHNIFSYKIITAFCVLGLFVLAPRFLAPLRKKYFT